MGLGLGCGVTLTPDGDARHERCGLVRCTLACTAGRDPCLCTLAHLVMYVWGAKKVVFAYLCKNPVSDSLKCSIFKMPRVIVLTVSITFISHFEPSITKHHVQYSSHCMPN